MRKLSVRVLGRLALLSAQQILVATGRRGKSVCPSGRDTFPYGLQRGSDPAATDESAGFASWIVRHTGR